MPSKMLPTAANNDVELVNESLAGDRNAFGQIVLRYQSLVCSLAYSATGSLTASEDLAQETFVAAWKQLAALREPEKLRAWLCGIARNLIRNAQRKDGREPCHQAESLEDVAESHSPEPCPTEQAISNEEAALLWRSLECIPEIYREPIVLFYREHQSIETVAQNLELTEDAVKQRLSRGRKLLHEQVLAFVEGALARTSPGQVFTLCVLAALPAMTMSARAATVGAAAKGGATAKGAGMIALGGAVLVPLIAFLNLWAQYRAFRATARSDRERRMYLIFYAGLAGSIVLMILLCSLLTAHGRPMVKTHPAVFAGLMMGLIAGYPAVLAPFCLWYYRTARRLTSEREATTGKAATPKKTPGWEYRSRMQWLGLPLIHVRFGSYRVDEPMVDLKQVKAWIAVTDSVAFGVLFAYGSVAVAPVSMGACAIGLLSYGGFAVSALAVGGFAFGIWAFGAIGFGWQASAGCAFAWDIASGAQYAIAHHFALAPTAHAAQANNELVGSLVKANPFLQVCWMIVPYFSWVIWLWATPMIVSMVVQWWVMARRRLGQPERQNLNDAL